MRDLRNRSYHTELLHMFGPRGWQGLGNGRVRAPYGRPLTAYAFVSSF